MYFAEPDRNLLLSIKCGVAIGKGLRPDSPVEYVNPLVEAFQVPRRTPPVQSVSAERSEESETLLRAFRAISNAPSNISEMFFLDIHFELARLAADRTVEQADLSSAFMKIYAIRPKVLTGRGRKRYGTPIW